MGQSNDSSQLKEKVLQHLNDKYGDDFEVTQMTREFSGDRGEFYRAVCKTDKREENCVVYCYPKEKNDDAVSYEMIDDYANIVLQEQYAEEISALVGPNAMVKCQIFFPNHMLTDAEYALGLEVLKKEELYPRTFVFVFTESMNANVREQVENYMKEKAVYMQYLYVTYQDAIDFEYWENFYYENYNSFERYLKESEKAEVIEFTAFTLEEGIQTRKTVKE